MDIKAKLETVIKATGSKKYWDEKLIEDFINYVYKNNLFVIADDILDHYKWNGDEFKFSTILHDIREKTKVKELSKPVDPVEQELVTNLLELINIITKKSQTIDQFFTELEDVRQFLIKKGVWQDEGRWAKWEEEEEKQTNE